MDEDMFWLGDASGWQIWPWPIEDEGDGAIRVEHRCGYGVDVHAPGNYLANIIQDVVKPHTRCS